MPRVGNAPQFPQYMPTWNHTQRYPPLTAFEYKDPAIGADPTFCDILKSSNGSPVSLKSLTPCMGTVVARDVQFSRISKAGKQQLALLTAQRKAVIFKDQDLASLPLRQVLEWGSFFGRHHVPPTSGTPEGFPEIQIAHRGAGDDGFEQFFKYNTTSVAWHSEASFEARPPGITIMFMLETPTCGGDTIFSNQVEAYRCLSSAMQKCVHGLKALHSGKRQAKSAKARGGILPRDAVENLHTIVRIHPATGEKALFVNRQCK